MVPVNDDVLPKHVGEFVFMDNIKFYTIYMHIYWYI